MKTRHLCGILGTQIYEKQAMIITIMALAKFAHNLNVHIT